MIAISTVLKPVRGRGRKAYVPRDAEPVEFKRESSAMFFGRLHSTLKALQKIEAQLPREVWRRFIAAYSQHWLYSLNNGERAATPAVFYIEWAEVQAKGSIEMNTEHPGHEQRHYGVYDTPSDVFVSELSKRQKKSERGARSRAKARAVLGLDAEASRTSAREDARRVLGIKG